MAKFVLGGIITNMAGSVGGTTFRRVPNGFSMYNKIKGASVAKLLQNTRVPQIANIFQRWALLSDSERSGWNATALTVTFPDKFGVAKNLTGRQLFSKANIQGLPAGIAINDSTGFTTDLVEWNLDTVTMNLTSNLAQMTVTSVDTTTQLLVSVEISNKQIYQPTFKSRKVIFIGGEDSGTVTQSFLTEFLANYDYASTGMWYAVYVQEMNQFGMLSPYQFKIGQIL